jgi:hypothetical protein
VSAWHRWRETMIRANSANTVNTLAGISTATLGVREATDTVDRSPRSRMVVPIQP